MEQSMRFEIKLTAKDLWRFSMHHSNSGMLGVFNVIFTAAALFLLVTRWSVIGTGQRLLLVVCALIFTVWQPMLLYRKACKQARLPAVSQPMYLTFDPEGVHVEQNSQNADFTWEQVGRIVELKKMTIIYMDRVHAFLLPERFLSERQDAFLALLIQYLPKGRFRRTPW